MKAVIIVDSESNSTHPMEAVLERRGFVVLRAATTAEAIKVLNNPETPADLVIVDVPLTGSTSQMEAVSQIRGSSPEIPILLVSELSLDKWPESDFMQFGKLLSGRVDLLVKPLSQASFVAKANSLIYTVSYGDSKRLFESASASRQEIARVWQAAEKGS